MTIRVIKRYWKNIILLLISVVVSLIIIEVVVKWYVPFIPNIWFAGGSHERGLVKYDKEIGYVLTPGFVGKDIQRNNEFKIDVRINNLGYRDFERQINEKASLIIGIGDSMTYGEGVKLEDSFLSLLESVIQDSTSTEWQIIKAGVPGYNVNQMKKLLKRSLVLANPRIVIVGFLPEESNRLDNPFVEFNGYIVAKNYRDSLDFYNDSIIYSSFKRKYLRQTDIWMQKHSIAFRLASPRIYNIAVKANKLFNREGESALHIDNSGRSDIGKYSKAIGELIKMKQIINENTKLIVLLIPSSGNNADYSKLKAELEHNGIYVLDLSALNGREYRYKIDGHWNNNGHKKAAEKIYNYLMTNNII